MILRCYPDPYGFLFETVMSTKNIRINNSIAGEELRKVIPESCVVTLTFADEITIDTVFGGLIITAENPLYYILYAFKVSNK